jgi:type II secretory pathway component PulK
MLRSPSSRRRGSALILVLWCLLLLGMAVFGVVEMVELSVEHTSNEERALDARGLALSGLAIGLNQQIKRDDPLLAQNPAPDRSFKVIVESSGARMNLNYVLLSKHREILENLFTQWGMPMDQAEHVADCMYDWVTPGDLKSLNGAKADDYQKANLPQRPTYTQFQSLEEVEQVMGMDLLEKAKPNWKDSFTLWSQGPLDVKEAPYDLIAAVFSLDPKEVALFTKTRDGRDGIAGTYDDVPVPNIKVLQSDLGLSNSAISLLGNQVSFGSGNRRIDSTGIVGGTQVEISVVTRLNSSPIQYFLWSEQ